MKEPSMIDNINRKTFTKAQFDALYHSCTVKSLAEEFGVSQGTIYNIRKRLGIGKKTNKKIIIK